MKESLRVDTQIVSAKSDLADPTLSNVSVLSQLLHLGLPTKLLGKKKQRAPPPDQQRPPRKATGTWPSKALRGR